MGTYPRRDVLCDLVGRQPPDMPSEGQLGARPQVNEPSVDGTQTRVEHLAHRPVPLIDLFWQVVPGDPAADLGSGPPFQ
jgi:hypothetical protein